MFGMGMGRLGLPNRLAALAAAAFNPATLFSGGQQGAWYDPSDFASMFQDTAGATPVTATGQAVARINDKSGRGYHLLQATAAARPIVRLNAASRYYLEFDGVNDNLRVAFGVGLTNPTTVLTGFSYSGTPANSYVYDSFSGIQLATFISAETNVMAYSMDALVGTTLATNTLTVLTTAFNGASSSMRRNGTLQTSGSLTSVTGNGITLGTDNGGTNYLAMRFYGLVYVNRVLTTQEITDTETYVNSKTGAY